MAVAALLQHRDGPGDQRKDGQVRDEGGRQAPGLDERGGSERGQAGPPAEVGGRDHGADDEEQQRDQHARIAAADREQRARGAAAAQLHADAEQEGAQHHGHARGRHEAADRLAEQRARGEEGEEQQHAGAQHEHLRPQAGAAAVGHEDAPGLGKAEGGVVERDAEQGADDPQRALSPADGLVQVQRAGQHQQQGNPQRLAIDADRRQGRSGQGQGRGVGAHGRVPEGVGVKMQTGARTHPWDA